LILVPLTMYSLLNDVSLVPENCECAFASGMHFPVEGWVSDFLFLGEVRWWYSSDWLFNCRW